MTRSIAAELLKLRTTRTFWWFMGSALVLVLAVSIPICAFVNFTDEGPIEVLLYILGIFVQAFALLLGILAVTSEFRHGTITPSLLVVPDRVRLVAAKLIAALAIGLALGVVSTGLVLLIGVGFGSSRGYDTSGDHFGMFVGGTLAVALYAALGVGLGMVVRNQVGAVVGALGYIFVIEPLLSQLISLVDALGDVLSTYGLGAVRNGLTGVDEGGESLLNQLPAGLLLTAYVAGFVVLGTVLFRRRDVTA